MKLRDLKDMPVRPGSEPPKNGMDSVSRGLVRIEHLVFKIFRDGQLVTQEGDYPYCVHFGAMNKVDPGIWRGMECHCGAWDSDDVRP